MGGIFLFILDKEFRGGNGCSSKLYVQGYPTHLISSLQSQRAALNPELTPRTALASTAFDNGHHMWPRANYLLLDCLFHPCNIHKVNKSYQS